MTEFRLLSYDQAGRPVAGVMVGDMVYPADMLLRESGLNAGSVLGLLEQWDEALPEIDRVASDISRYEGIPLGEVKLLAPVLYPSAIYCAAANYYDHMHAMAVKLNQPDEPDPKELDINPYHFVLPGRTCTNGPADPIKIPSHGTRIDWEIELVAVIGKPASNVPVDRALDYIAAYTIGNDVSVRDHRFIKIPNVGDHSVFRNDFIGMKGFDQACTVGPWLVPAREIPDPQNVKLKLWVNDELMQDSHTSQMVFSTAEQISYLSSRVTLLPGDLVFTGTPAGTGMERDRFLEPGETVRMLIDGIGEITQPVVR